MAGPLRLPRSVRGRSAAAAALAMALVLGVGGTWLYSVLRANLLDNAHGRTELAAREVAARADAGPLPELLPAPRDGVDVVLVLGARGEVVATTRPSAGPLAREFAGLRPAPGGDTASALARYAGQRGDLVVVRSSAPGGGGERYVYALTVLNDVDDATHAVALGMLAAAPPLVALAAAIAWAVTGLALRPVTTIRTELAAVTASELDRRVPEPAGGDEVALLARTVNGTLDRLEQAVGRQRQFVADASHELRNPVAAVRSQLEVALAAPGGPAPEAVRAALEDTVRLQRVAADLLLLARLDARVPTTPGEPVDLALLAAEEAARRPGARVPVTVEADAPVPLRGRAGQLERLAANLVDNAVRHAASRVTVRAYARDGSAVLEVADDGPGIPADERERVFERFVRLDAARDRERGGSGLGLAIAREIAHAHGGTLTASAAPGGGALLVARLPAGPAG
ncbi:HAMP domain-containing histidine kinase [Streptomyces sp. HU2014]|uniref:sensor histidine kinase n=1 Tax=Streptomyces sp. HU2014 TaxID=2939414 RepID=UPI00200BC6EB|nr:HAMP domain-containing sensor histidine kinase [Streptomyces sp. HU2014]UQI44728.1 HAMP domain-containing histidine kinase [Streptomyces sp. HU2014]